MSAFPNDLPTPSELPQPTPTQAFPAAPKKSAHMSASATAEKAKRDSKKKGLTDKAALAAKLSRKAAEKKKTKVTTNLQGLKDALHDFDTALPPSDMEISDEELPPPAIGTKNPFAHLPVDDEEPQEETHAEPMATDDDTTSQKPQPADEAAQETNLPPAPATPTHPDQNPTTGEADTPGGDTTELDDFVRRHAQSINFSSPPNSSPFLKNAPRVGLKGPNRPAFVAPTPDYAGEGVQELFPPNPDKAQGAPAPSKESLPPPAAAPTPASESDIRLLARLQRAAAYTPVPPPPASETLNESEFTSGPFPIIHDLNPVRALAFIDELQVLSWNRTEGGKFIARLFDPAREPRSHATIASIIQQAVATITNSPQARVATPVCKYTNPQPDVTPNAFLVFAISEEAAKAMITASVWSSSVLTFQALELNPPLPTYLFPVSGFATAASDETVTKVIKECWLAADSVAEIRELIARANSEPDCTVILTERDVARFIDSLTVSPLATKASGSHLRPTHRLHADPSVLKADHHLYELRAHFRTLEYPTHYDGSGAPEPDWDCPICHSVDHPKGMCPFPDIPGWNGPRRYLEKKEKLFRGKALTRGGNTRGAGRGRGMKRAY